MSALPIKTDGPRRTVKTAGLKAPGRVPPAVPPTKGAGELGGSPALIVDYAGLRDPRLLRREIRLVEHLEQLVGDVSRDLKTGPATPFLEVLKRFRGDLEQELMKCPAPRPPIAGVIALEAGRGLGRLQLELERVEGVTRDRVLSIERRLEALEARAGAQAQCEVCQVWVDAEADFCHGCKRVVCVVCSEGLPRGGHKFEEHVKICKALERYPGELTRVRDPRAAGGASSERRPASKSKSSDRGSRAPDRSRRRRRAASSPRSA